MIRHALIAAAALVALPADAMVCRFAMPTGGTTRVAMHLDAPARTITADPGGAPLVFHVLYDDETVILARNTTPQIYITLRFDVATGRVEQRVTSRASGDDVMDIHGQCGR